MTNFYATADNFETTTTGYTAAAGSIALASGAGAALAALTGAISAGNPVAFSTFLEDGTPKGVYVATGRSGDTLTGLTLLSGTDATLPADAVVSIRWTASHAGQVAAAINALEASLDDLLNPYQSPAFASFAITGVSSPVEVGSSISGTKTFTWSTSNGGNVAANSVGIVDATASTTLLSGSADDGSQAIALPVAVTHSAPATHSWTISATDTHSAAFSRTLAVAWQWKAYAGTSASATLSAGAIQALSDHAALASTAARTYALAAGNYKFLAIPASFTAPSSFRDADTGFTVPMADSSDDAAYSGTANGLGYATVSVTNGNGVATDYRVYRSKYALGGALNLQVS